MNKFTEGPWRVVPTPESSNQRFKVMSKLSVASIYYDRNDEANARLIAAAPELLEACQFAIMFIDRIKSGSIGPDEISEADMRLIAGSIKAAIAKAEGR